MNVYAVISEPIEYEEDVIPELGCGPKYDYRISELVAAPSRGRAKWLAWQSDADFRNHGDIRDMPNFSVKLIRKDEEWPEGICSKFEHLWAWGVPRPWAQSEALLVENYLDYWAKYTHGDRGAA